MIPNLVLGVIFPVFASVGSLLANCDQEHDCSSLADPVVLLQTELQHRGEIGDGDVFAHALEDGPQLNFNVIGQLNHELRTDEIHSDGVAEPGGIAQGIAYDAYDSEDVHHADEGHGADAHDAHGVPDMHHSDDDHEIDSNHVTAHDVHGSAHGVHDSSGHASHHEVDPVAKALSLELISMVTVVMTLFYLVNWPNETIRRETWRILASTVSIFCAIMVFDSFRKVSQEIFGEPLDAHHDGYYPPPPIWILRCNFARAVVFYVLLQVVLILVSKWHWVLHAIGIMGGHVLGFACIEAFGTLQQYEPFSNSPMTTLCEAVFSVVALLVIFFLMSTFRNAVCTDCAWKDFKHQMAESEDDAVALMGGLLFCQCIKYAIVGHLSPVHGAPKGKSSTQVWSLFAAALVLALLAYLQTRMLDREIHRHASAQKKRVITFLQLNTCMTSGWCLLYWGQWFFWSSTSEQGVGEGGKMSARMLMGLAFALLGVLTIFFLENARYFRILEEEALQALVTTAGLMVGLSWEACFTTAVGDLSTGSDVAGVPQRLVSAIVSSSIAIVVAPAWGMYILPKALEFKHESESEAEQNK